MVTGSLQGTHVITLERGFADRLAAVDQFGLPPGSIRMGWLCVAGRNRSTIGKEVRVFEPW